MIISKTYGHTRRQLGSHIVWFSLWFVITAIAAYLTPNPHGHGTHQQLGLPPCPSVIMFGRPCPGCGLTTSFTSMVHGQFIHAFQANPFGPILYLAFTISAFYCLYGFIKGIKYDMNTKHGNMAIIGFMVAYMVFGVARFSLTDPVQYASQYWHPGGLNASATTADTTARR